mgnify:CR=1 FL=1|tara:strand:+ start:132 stop:581 length:450 start_codon:yes stop_codon:yes gene_type:complete
MQLLLINGPNINLLGHREPQIYGSNTLESLEQSLKENADREGFRLDCFQSNCEGDIVDRIHQSIGNVDGILINAGAYTHTSIALRDALLSVQIPYVELHMSNVYAREDFRQNSFISDKAIGLVIGFGEMSYSLAMHGLVNYLQRLSETN